MSFMKWLTASGLALTLFGCGGGGSEPVAGGQKPPTGGGSNTPTTALSLSVQLLDEANNSQPTTALNVGNPLKVRAVLTQTVTQTNGSVSSQPLANQLVQFSIEQDPRVAELDPVSGSQLTDAQGVAELKVKSLGGVAGAGTVKAKVSYSKDGKDATTVFSGANFYTAGSTPTQPKTLNLSAISVTSGTTPISSYGTTGVSVRVLEDGQPYTVPTIVSFTTSCPDGKGGITPSVTTQPDGWAVATFLDNGCAQVTDKTVTIRASISTDTKTKDITVRAPTAGSLRFVSADPVDKSILTSNSGGSGRKKDATLWFKLVDVAGNGVADVDVCFDATTYVGGLLLEGFSPTKLPPQPGTTALCGSDEISKVRYVKRTDAEGVVTIKINSGITPTPVRVRARTLYPATNPLVLETFSDTISISTGLPLQRSFSLSVDQANIDGGNDDGEIAKVTVRLADEFSNPVPDGTTVNFIASGAAVCTASKGACDTVNGTCSCDVVSQERRPQDNRVVVMAYAIGMEDYDDSNGDNVYTAGVDRFYDLGDAYVDANKDEIVTYDDAGKVKTVNGDTDTLIAYQSVNGFQNAGDGKRGMAHIRRSTVIFLGQDSGTDPTAVIAKSLMYREVDLTTTGEAVWEPFFWLKSYCPGASASVPAHVLRLRVDDGMGNPLAAGTVLRIVDSSANLAAGDIRPDKVLALGARKPDVGIDFAQPHFNTPKVTPWASYYHFGNVVTDHTIVVEGVQDKCIGTGKFALEVESPRGPKNLVRLLYEDESRSVERNVLEYRYAPVITFAIPDKGNVNSPVALIPQRWIPRVEGRKAVTYSIDWGDGTAPTSGNAINGVIPTAYHTYASSNAYSVTMTIVDNAGDVYVHASGANEGKLISIFP